ncbi:hypothetical protein H6P81_000414 [Aristolochia fimbriata]|uniref:Uncharacterized protein n=1 Tax=Aristolochia fimbriata TaxID=158543 RepID=A0AAV7F732_ARIFI|nr:hypothetical protein H6P81_000414 [Aristolochia fimbriata]
MKKMSTFSALILFLLISSGLERLHVSAHYLTILAPKREAAASDLEVPQTNGHQLQAGDLRGRVMEGYSENDQGAHVRHDGGRGGGSRGGGTGLVRPKSKENGASPRLPLSPFLIVTLGLLLQVFF